MNSSGTGIQMIILWLLLSFIVLTGASYPDLDQYHGVQINGDIPMLKTRESNDTIASFEESLHSMIDTSAVQMGRNFHHINTTMTTRTSSLYIRKLRGRTLQGGASSYDDIDFESIEMGFMLCLLAIAALTILLCFCCCCGLLGGRNNNGGGGRSSSFLWDCVALVCLWELCCGRNDNNFMDAAPDFQLCGGVMD